MNEEEKLSVNGFEVDLTDFPNSNDLRLPPPPPTPEELDKIKQIATFKKDMLKYTCSNDCNNFMLDLAEKYEKPKFTLSYNGVPFAPIGGVHCLTGQSGNGKTMVLTQLMVAILGGACGKLKSEYSKEETPSVLYVDTEMEKQNTLAVFARVYEMLGWTPGGIHDNLHVLKLREVTTAKERWALTLQAIFEKRPTFVFLDGLLDLVDNINDYKECSDRIYECMKIASLFDASVWFVIHENPNTDKIAGHLGSVAEKKSTDILKTKKEKSQTTDFVHFVVTQTKARSKDISKWCFEVVDGKNHLGIPQEIDDVKGQNDSEKGSNKSETMTEQEKCLALFNAIAFPPGGLTYKELIAQIMVVSSKSETTCERRIKSAVNYGIIHQDSITQKYYIGKANN